jgi:hypothetical protein
MQDNNFFKFAWYLLSWKLKIIIVATIIVLVAFFIFLTTLAQSIGSLARYKCIEKMTDTQEVTDAVNKFPELNKILDYVK